MLCLAESGRVQETGPKWTCELLISCAPTDSDSYATLNNLRAYGWHYCHHGSTAKCSPDAHAPRRSPRHLLRHDGHPRCTRILCSAELRRRTEVPVSEGYFDSELPLLHVVRLTILCGTALVTLWLSKAACCLFSGPFNDADSQCVSKK